MSEQAGNILIRKLLLQLCACKLRFEVLEMLDSGPLNNPVFRAENVVEHLPFLRWKHDRKRGNVCSY